MPAANSVLMDQLPLAEQVAVWWGISYLFSYTFLCTVRVLGIVEATPNYNTLWFSHHSKVGLAPVSSSIQAAITESHQLSTDSIYTQFIHRLWCWEVLRAGGKGDDRGWDGWMALPTRWMWVWVSSRSWWWTGRPGVLRFMGSQRVGHDWATELNWLNWEF